MNAYKSPYCYQPCCADHVGNLRHHCERCGVDTPRLHARSFTYTSVGGYPVHTYEDLCLDCTITTRGAMEGGR